eukprot:m.73899 g.73899  ORF g.73899 m.73899 type:complete len:209 (+) comp12438_c0_seq1:167-793(+)
MAGNIAELAHAVKFEASALPDLVKRLIAAIRSECDADHQVALSKAKDENEKLRRRMRQNEADSEARFEQVKADSLHLAGVWESEKRRLEDELRRSREMIEVERENTKRMTLMTEEIRAEAMRETRNAESECAEELMRIRNLAATAAAERDAITAEAEWLRRELRALKESLAKMENQLQARDRAVLHDIVSRPPPPEVHYSYRRVEERS